MGTSFEFEAAVRAMNAIFALAILIAVQGSLSEAIPNEDPNKWTNYYSNRLLQANRDAAPSMTEEQFEEHFHLKPILDIYQYQTHQTALMRSQKQVRGERGFCRRKKDPVRSDQRV